MFYSSINYINAMTGYTYIEHNPPAIVALHCTITIYQSRIKCS